MNSSLRQRAGTALAAVGLVIVATAGAFVGAGSAGAAEQTAPVCNNLHQGEDPGSCHSGGPYGSVAWDITGGNLVLHVTADEGIGWSDIRVCAPYGPPTDGADCQPNDAGLIPTSAYTIAMVVPAAPPAESTDGKKYTFEPCGKEFIVTVPMSQIAAPSASDWLWAIHLAPGGGRGCGGTGTHEAFGLVPAPATTTTTLGDTTTTTAGDTTTTTAGGTTTTTGGETTTTTLGETTTTTLGETTTTTAGDTTTTTVGDSTTTTTAGNTGSGPTTTTTANSTTTTGGSEVSGVTAAKPGTDVLGEEVLPDPVTALPQPVEGTTLPRTGGAPRALLCLAGVALVLGGLALQFGKPSSVQS